MPKLAILFIVIFIIVLFENYIYCSRRGYFSDISVFDTQYETFGVYNLREIEPVILQRN